MELIRQIRVGMTREEVVAALGPPDDTGGMSRKYRTHAIYKYGDIELHFEPWKTGRLLRAWRDHVAVIFPSLSSPPMIAGADAPDVGVPRKRA